MLRTLATSCLFVGLFVIGMPISGATDPSEFTLKKECPRGFERTQSNRCKLRSLYQFYESTQGRGVGGTHTGLPAYRDGFSPQQIDLGRYLFFDPMLSRDGTVSCASCHHPDLGFADGQAVSTGVDGRVGKRSAPSLWNSAFLSSYFWDARATTLEQQAEGPLYAKDEMGSSPELLLSSLRDNSVYPRLFAEAFSESGGLTLQNIYQALTAFQLSLISLNSRYDEYAHGNHAALNDDEIAGLNVFRSFVARCSQCHTEPLFTNNQIAVIGVPEPDGVTFDVGAQLTYQSSKLKGGFKVPTLRNIAKTAPYMHSGVFADLREATEFYNKGRGHAVPDGVSLQIHWHITEPDLTDQEIDLLVTFMHTLTDEKFMPEIPLAVPSGLRPVRRLNSSQKLANLRGVNQ